MRDLESGRSFINDTADDPWGQSLDLTSMLLDRYGELREHRQPRPYWPARHGAERQGRGDLDPQPSQRSPA